MWNYFSASKHTIVLIANFPGGNKDLRKVLVSLISNIFLIHETSYHNINI